MMKTAMQPPTMPPALIERAVALNSTGEYIRVLIEVALDTAWDIRDHLRREGALGATGENWRRMETLLNLAHDQAEIVLDVGREADETSIATYQTAGRSSS